MDLMDIRREMMGVIAQMAGGSLGDWKKTTVTITTKRYNTRAIADDLLAVLPTFDVAFASKDIDYSESPYNTSLVSLCGINGDYYAGVRYINGSYTYASIVTNYGTGIADVGETYTVLYK